MLNPIELLRDAVGIEPVADLGTIYEGRIGAAECEVGLSFELWQECYHVCVRVSNRKLAGERVSIVKWPYSRTTVTDLNAVIADFDALPTIGRGEQRSDDRTWWERSVDFVTRTKHLGRHRFTSVLPDPQIVPRKVEASIVRIANRETDVWLNESRQPGVIVIAQFPLEACAKIRQVLADFAD